MSCGRPGCTCGGDQGDTHEPHRHEEHDCGSHGHAGEGHGCCKATTPREETTDAEDQGAAASRA